jgi:hypothetical protein
MKELKTIDGMSEGLTIRHIDQKNLRECIEGAKFIITAENKLELEEVKR